VLPRRIGEFPKGVCDTRVKVVAGFLHPVPRATGIRSLEPVCCGDVQEKREIGYETGGSKCVGGADFRLRQSAPDDLIGVRRQKETVEQDYETVAQRRPDLPRNELRAGRHEKQCFTRRCYLLLGMEQNLSDVVANWRAPGLAHRNRGNAGGRQPLRQNSNLGGFPRAFGSLEDDQPTARHSQDRVMIGLAAPFFIPSMIH